MCVERAKEKKNTYLTYMTGRIQGKVFMLTCGKIVYYHGSSINKKSAVLADLIKQVVCQCLALISLAELAFTPATEEELRIVKSNSQAYQPSTFETSNLQNWRTRGKREFCDPNPSPLLRLARRCRNLS